MKKHIRTAAVAMIIVSLLASVSLNYFRFLAEASYKSAHILVDYDELYNLAVANGQGLGELAARFREAGATGVMVRERTLEDLEQRGLITLLKLGEAALFKEFDPDIFSGLREKPGYTYIITKDSVIYENISAELQAMGKDFTSTHNRDNYLICAGITEKEYEKMGVGFIRPGLEEIAGAGLAVAPRLRECSKSTEQSLDLMAENLAALPGLALVAFNDPVIMGANNIPYLAEKLKELNVPAGAFEFFKQAGLNQLALELDKNLLRIHSISEEEMDNYNEGMAVDRFKLAAAERNIRVLYVRLFGMNHPSSALQRGLDYIGSVREGLAAEGLSAGAPAPLGAIPYSRALMFLIGLGVVGAGLLALGLVTTPFWQLVLGLLGVLGWGGLLLFDPMLARKGFALLSVIIYPVLGVIYFLDDSPRSLPEAVASLLKMSAVSLAGAVIMTGLLADRTFMLTLNTFSGVKLAHLLPLVLIPGYFFYKGGRPVRRLGEVLDYPVKNKHVLLGLALFTVLAVYLIRTGNEAPQLVTSWEVALRDFLDQALGVRPRTKEFLLGHPAMLVLLYFGYDLRKIVVLLLGVIGQVSLVNTYAHLHTPLAVSLLRSFHGLWLGILLGVAAVILLNYLLAFLKKKGALKSE